MDRKLTREALRLMELHQPFVRATVVQSEGSVPGKVGATMIVRADRSTLGTVGGAALEEQVKAIAEETFERRVGRLAHFELKSWVKGGLPSLCGGSVDVAIEYVAARPNVLLWGGGHVAHALARIFPTLEYDYSIADDRPEFVRPERFPDADVREVTEPEHLFDRFAPAVYTHLFVLGYDAQKDIDVLHEALGKFPHAIGFIASRAKRAHAFAELRRRGADEGALQRIRAPVGIPIGAQTPEEIAISIVAEMIEGFHPAPTAKNPVVSRTRKLPHAPQHS